MMPFALDLISTFVIGSILPVATTDRTIVPRLDGHDFGRVDVGRRALETDESGDRSHNHEDGDDAQIQTFSRRLSCWHTLVSYVISGREVQMILR